MKAATQSQQWQGYVVWGTALIGGKYYFAQLSKSLPTYDDAKRFIAGMKNPPSDVCIHGHSREGL